MTTRKEVSAASCEPDLDTVGVSGSKPLGPTRKLPSRVRLPARPRAARELEPRGVFAVVLDPRRSVSSSDYPATRIHGMAGLDAAHDACRLSAVLGELHQGPVVSSD